MTEQKTDLPSWITALPPWIRAIGALLGGLGGLAALIALFALSSPNPQSQSRNDPGLASEQPAGKIEPAAVASEPQDDVAAPPLPAGKIEPAAVASEPQDEEPPPTAEWVPQAAFDALDRAKKTKDQARKVESLALAKEEADTCVAKLQELADKKQAELLAAHERVIEPDKVGDSDEERKRIFRRGPLNDIGACLFVKVAANVGLKDATAAEQSYAQLCRYPHALVWDPKGPWFWSPPISARGELRTLGLTPAMCP